MKKTLSKPENTETVQEKLDRGGNVNIATGGLVHSDPLSPRYAFNRASNEYIIRNNDAFVVFGQDRPSDESTGAGALGFPSETIDLVTGRKSSTNDGNGPKSNEIVNNDFVTDAARIYISKKTKIDTHFGIDREDSNKEQWRSAVALKADHLRLFGREHIKIVTGHTKGIAEKNSTGGDYERAGRIDLIAGNHVGSQIVQLPEMVKKLGKAFFPHFEPEVKYLQPLIKGDNLEIALKEMNDHIQSLTGIVLTQATMLTAVMGAMAVNPLPHYPAACSAYITGNTLAATTPLWSLKTQIAAWETNYLNENATRYICSRNVRTT